MSTPSSDAPRPARFGARILGSLLLFAAAAQADGGMRLAIVEPDVEIMAAGPCDATTLPSATRSEAVVDAWPRAVAAAVGASIVPVAWSPGTTLAPDDPRVQALALQQAIDDAVRAGEVRAADRRLSLGDGAHALAAATGATHAVFLRIRGGCRGDAAVAMLVDLRDGAVVRHVASPAFDARADAVSRTDEVARRLLPGAAAGATWSVLPPATPAPTGDGVSGPADVARAVARHDALLRRDPRRLVSPSFDAYLKDVACRVDAVGCAPLRIHVIRDAGAHAVMSGPVLMLRSGMLLRIRDEAELAFVLAHELAHLRAGDGLPGIRPGAPGERDAARSRATELARDREAAERLAAAGYDALAPARLWRRLLDEEPPRGSTAARTHPLLGERLARLPRRAGPVPGDRGEARWQSQWAPFRRAWLADEVAFGSAPATASMLAAGVADAERAGDPAAIADWAAARARHGRGRQPAVSDAARTPAPAIDGRSPGTSAGKTWRVLGLRLPSRERWIRRKGIGAELWTIDGTPLNRLLIVSGVRHGEPMLRDVAPAAPRWDGAREPGTILDGILRTLHALDWRDVAADGLRPHDFGGMPGWRAELSGAAASGLRYRGTLAFAVRDGRLTLLLWLAPAVHYHGRDAASVAATLDGMRFAR